MVFALIDSLTLQSSFSGVRLESYMFTEESFRAVRDRLDTDGLLVVYNYFREKWLVDRLANTAAVAFGSEPRVHVHEARAYLGIILAGPRLATLKHDPVIPDQVAAYSQGNAPSPARMHVRDATVEPATDDWPFLYLHTRHVPRHYLGDAGPDPGRLAGGRVRDAARPGRLVVVGVLLPRRRVHAARDESDHPVRAAVGIDLGGGVDGDRGRAEHGAGRQLHRVAGRGAAALAGRRGLIGLLALNALIPVGRVTFESRAAESIFYALLMFSPILCAGLLFGSAIEYSKSLPRDFGTNLLGAMSAGWRNICRWSPGSACCSAWWRCSTSARC